VELMQAFWRRVLNPMMAALERIWHSRILSEVTWCQSKRLIMILFHRPTIKHHSLLGSKEQHS